MATSGKKHWPPMGRTQWPLTLGKYDLSFFDGDDTARRASIRREKEREVALQLVTRAGAHWTWGDLLRPDRLARILTAAGVPRSV